MLPSTREHVVKALQTAATRIVTATEYNAEDPEHRRELGKQLTEKLEAAGFKKLPAKSSGTEDVYAFAHRKDPGLQVKVFTSVVGGSVRKLAKDAIRVCLTYQNKAMREGHPTEGRELPVNDSCTVYRTGTLDRIVERTVTRAREMYKAANAVERCPKCGAPMVKNKQGKLYCSEKCWLKTEPPQQYHSKPSSHMPAPSGAEQRRGNPELPRNLGIPDWCWRVMDGPARAKEIKWRQGLIDDNQGRPPPQHIVDLWNKELSEHIEEIERAQDGDGSDDEQDPNERNQI